MISDDICIDIVYSDQRDVDRLRTSEARWTLAADPPARIDYIFASNDFSRIGASHGASQLMSM